MRQDCARFFPYNWGEPTKPSTRKYDSLRLIEGIYDYAVGGKYIYTYVCNSGMIGMSQCVVFFRFEQNRPTTIEGRISKKTAWQRLDGTHIRVETTLLPGELKIRLLHFYNKLNLMETEFSAACNFPRTFIIF